MTLLSRLIGGRRTEQRSLSRFDVLGSGSSAIVLGSGIESALRLIPLFAGAGRIADALAGTPLHAYRDATGGRQRLAEQPKLVSDPMPGGERFTWLNQAAMSLLLRGNAYGLILDWDKRGVPSQIRWLSPAKVDVDERGALPEYAYNGRQLDRGQVLHIPGLTLPGRFVGLSPVGLFKTQIETGMRVDRYTNDWFDTGVAPTGHLKNTNRVLNAGESQMAKDSFRRAVEHHDFWVSGNDWEWSPLTVPAAEAQFLETTRATATQIATILRLSPEDVGGETGGSSLTYSTLELNEMKFIRRAVMPWTNRIESVFRRLLPDGEYVKFNLDSMVRADLKTRMEAHRIALEIGLETLDEGRALEDKLPLTSDELESWQQQQGKAAGPADRALKLAGLVQKIYLGVGTVLTAEEAREIANLAGAGLGATPANLSSKGEQ